MRAEELMIGDWVKCSTESGKVTFVQTEIEDFDFMNHCTDEDLERLEGIPLTEDILKVNRWSTPKYNGGVSSQYETHGGDTCITIDAIHHCLDIRIDDINYDLPTPRYVHELQHALRLCGLNDLADNFKAN